MGCPSEVTIGQSIIFSITTHDADTASLTDADTLPSYLVFEDLTGTAILTGTMAKLDDANTTGFYAESIACTTPNGFEDGKTYTIYIEATVAGTTGGISYGFKALANVIENGLTTEQVMRALLAALAGKSSGGGTPTLKFRDNADTKDRIVATVDGTGNRLVVVLDLSP